MAAKARRTAAMGAESVVDVARAHGFYYIAGLPKRTVRPRPKSVVLLNGGNGFSSHHFRSDGRIQAGIYKSRGRLFIGFPAR